MKRTNEEFKAEVFRRRDEYYKKRRKCISAITAAYVPLTVCVAFFTAMIIPAMMPASSADMSDPGENGNLYCSEIYCDESPQESITTTTATTTTVMADVEFLKTASEIYFTADGGATLRLCEEEAKDMLDYMAWVFSEEGQGTHEISKPTLLGKALYEIKIYSDIGEARTYSVYKDFIVSKEKLYYIEENDFEKIKAILGIDG